MIAVGNMLSSLKTELYHMVQKQSPKAQYQHKQRAGFLCFLCLHDFWLNTKKLQMWMHHTFHLAALVDTIHTFNVGPQS